MIRQSSQGAIALAFQWPALFAMEIPLTAQRNWSNWFCFGIVPIATTIVYAATIHLFPDVTLAFRGLLAEAPEWLSYAIDLALNIVVSIVSACFSIRLHNVMDRLYPWMDKPLQRLGLEYLGHFGIALLAIYTTGLVYDLIQVPTYGLDGDKDSFSLTLVISVSLYFFLITSYTAVLFFFRIIEAQAREAQLTRQNLTASLNALKNQLNPHFLFNSLSVLISLIEVDSDAAVRFVHNLSRIYRYLLQHHEEQEVILRQELDFLKDYLALLAQRFPTGIQWEFQVPESVLEKRLVPLSMQLAIENVVKHNMIRKDQPLQCTIRYVEETGPAVEIVNTLQPRNSVEPSNGVGLANLTEQYRLLGSARYPTTMIRDGQYILNIPLL